MHIFSKFDNGSSDETRERKIYGIFSFKIVLKNLNLLKYIKRIFVGSFNK